MIRLLLLALLLSVLPALGGCSTDARQGLLLEPGSVAIPLSGEATPNSIHQAVETWARDSFDFEHETVGDSIEQMTWHCVGRRILVTRHMVTDEVVSSVAIVSVYVPEGIDPAQSQALADSLEARFFGHRR